MPVVIRSSDIVFFRERAAQAQFDAAEATLEHVRQRCRRSEAAWMELAQKAERFEQIRSAEAERKRETLSISD